MSINHTKDVQGSNMRPATPQVKQLHGYELFTRQSSETAPCTMSIRASYIVLSRTLTAALVQDGATHVTLMIDLKAGKIAIVKAKKDNPNAFLLNINGRKATISCSSFCRMLINGGFGLQERNATRATTFDGWEAQLEK